jgi:hypothetical protein
MGSNFLQIRNGVTFGNQANAPSNPVNGDMYYDSTRNTFVRYNNGAWTDLQSRSDVATSATLTSANFTTAIVQSSLVRLTGSTSGTISGFAAMPDAKQFVLYNESTAAMSLLYQSVSEGTAANRVITPTGGDLIILPGQSVAVAYDSSQSRWVVISTQSIASGASTGSDLNSLQFRAVFVENFTESSTNAASAVNANAGFTNAVYNSSKQMYTMNYDASRTITTVGTAATLSGTPSFTVAAGDVVVNFATGEVKKIASISSQTVYTLESAFASNLSAQAVCVSQAVHTVDVYNYTANATAAAISAAFPGSNFSEIMLDYKDNAAANSNLWTPDVAPFAAFVASTDNSNWTSLQVRVTNETDIMQSAICPTVGSSLYLRFFSDKTSGTGFINLISYEAFMQKALAQTQGGIVWSAYATTNSSTTAINCTLSVLGGKTTVTFNSPNQYALGVNSGQTYGVLDVSLNGQILPRFVSGSIPTGDSYYTELSGNAIQLDQNYSSQNLDLQVVLRTQIVDTSTTNTTNITNMQEFIGDGFQGFINKNENLITATGTTGTPVAGTFYSSITNRISITDLSQDLKTRFAVERIMTPDITLVVGEKGSSGQPVWSPMNDINNKIRFIGGGWQSFGPGAGASANGSGILSTVVGDAVEITFYGTALNVLLYLSANARTFGVLVDGSAVSSVSPSTASTSGIIEGRSQNANSVTNIVSGLTLGVHTVTISLSSGPDIDIHGFEVIMQTSSGSNLVAVNPGVGYLNGKKRVLTAQNTFAYSAPVSGTTGGRVAIYQNADGSVGEAFTQNAASPSYMGSASHTNEEVVRVIHFREFGYGLSTDFSTLGTGSASAFGTLDDGTTTLVGSAVVIETASGFEAVAPAATSSYISINFIGTGLDIFIGGVGASFDNHTVYVDGVSQSTTLTGSATSKYVTIASGLSYGSHCVQIFRSAAAGSGIAIVQYIIYQPKTPSIPSGAMQIGSYNVLGNFSQGSTGTGQASQDAIISPGTIRKMNTRELTYSGTWATAVNIGYPSGLTIDSSTASSFVQYTFFGTGVVYMFANNAGAQNFQVSLDGSTNFTGVTNNLSATAGLTVTSTNPLTISGTPAASAFNTFAITGLSLGIHTVKITWISGAAIFPASFDVITPIHSPKYETQANYNNQLMIGSQGISDDRLTTPIKDDIPASKAWAQAFGVLSAPTTSSTTPIPMPDMACTVKTNGGALEISYSVMSLASNLDQFTQIYVDGISQGSSKYSFFSGAGAGFGSSDLVQSDTVIVPVSAGIHTVHVYWWVSGSTFTTDTTRRNLSVKEL